jgi:hypothetical protein
MIDTKTLRDQAAGLDPQFALVGFFSASRRGESLIPLADLTVCCLTRNPKARQYRNGSNRPAMLAAVPALYDTTDGQVHIGGPDWYWMRQDHKRVYLRQRQYCPVKRLLKSGVLGHEEKTRPVGVLRDLFEDDEKQSMCLTESRSFDTRLAEFAHAMLSTSKESDPCFNTYGDQSPSLPLFLSPITPTTYMKLRRGDELDQQVLHCAGTGEWGIPGLFTLSAPDNGILRGVSDSSVELWVPLIGITGEELLQAHASYSKGQPPTYRVETLEGQEYQVSTIENPTWAVEARVFDVFGVNICPIFKPAVSKGQSVQVRAGRAMFEPVPRRRCTLNELKARPDYEALCYVAALHSTYEAQGVEFLDLAYAFNPVKEPLVDFAGFSTVQKIRCSTAAGSKYKNHVTNLAAKGDGYTVDLLNISLRAEMRRKAREKEEKQRIAALGSAATAYVLDLTARVTEHAIS